MPRSNGRKTLRQVDRAAAQRAASHASEDTVSVRVVQRLIDAVEMAGVPRADVVHALGSYTTLLNAPDARLPRIEVDRMCELALDITGDPAFGLHWAQSLTERTFAPVSHMLAHTRSLRHGFALLSQYQPLFCDRECFELREIEDRAELRVYTDSAWRFSSARLERFASEMALAGFLILIRLFGTRESLTRVSFKYAAPPYAGEYLRAFGQPVGFEQSYAGLVFDRAVLDAKSPHADHDIHEAMQTVADRRLLSLTQHAPYALRVRELLREHIPARTNMSAVARALGMSVSSLRRQLAGEGTSYRAIEYAVLESVADHLLRDQRLTIQETAYAMGFSDATTFHRAFKQWTGRTPSAFRLSP